MKNSINNIRQFIDNLSEAVMIEYYRVQYQIFFKGYRSYVDDMISGVQGRLATLFYTLGRIKGELQGRYIVYKQNRSQPRTDTHNG
jgi:hypothetical protein